MQEKATSEPLHTASGDGGEEALPQGCQEQVMMIHECTTMLRCNTMPI